MIEIEQVISQHGEGGHGSPYSIVAPQTIDLGANIDTSGSRLDQLRNDINLARLQVFRALLPVIESAYMHTRKAVHTVGTIFHADEIKRDSKTKTTTITTKEGESFSYKSPDNEK